MIRGIVKSVVQGVIQRVSASVWGDGSIDDREFFQHYGYTSRPKSGAEVIFFRQGNCIIAIGSDDRRFRISIEEGEVALYTDEGDKIHLKRDRIIEIVGGKRVLVITEEAEVTATTSAKITSPTVTVIASASVTLDTPMVTCTGDLAVAGGISSTGNIESTGGEVKDSVRSMAGDRNIYNGHTHAEQGTGGGTTSSPTQGM